MGVVEQEQGDAEFQRFAEGCVGRLLQTARILTGSEVDAEDLSQDALAKVYSKWGRVRRADDPVAYANKILINMFLSSKRRRSLLLSRALDDHAVDRAASVDGQYDQVEDRQALVAALGQLPPGQKTAVVLKYLLDMSGKEMAQAMGVREASARAQLSRGLDALRELLANVDKEEICDGPS